MHGGKTVIYRVQYYPDFRHPLGALGCGGKAETHRLRILQSFSSCSMTILYEIRDYNRETGIVKGGGRGYDGIHSLMKLHQRHSILKPNTETHKSWHNCCVHCVLACLFCEFLTLCNIVLGQASCGICTSEACCCCCGDEMGDDCNCPCDMDCGIMDACCESSDCLEICMECCGICFPS
ncbi:hypothetical protein FD754_018278 [Muntiacus muntjak]|uniref:MyoD family inhibitor domain containing n=1 Tax=Muntiacus muntjak TaxID=9888 RepID=A0A5N3UX06_MUNMU|nr:hypothetical protein FD754_018278 [Muntiacus muntjak]